MSYAFWVICAGVFKYHARLVRTSWKFLFTCPGTSLKKVNTILYSVFDYYYEFVLCGKKNLDPDQMASSGSRLFSLYQFHTVFKKGLYNIFLKHIEGF